MAVSGVTGNATEQQFLTTVNVDGVGDIGVFDKFTGGDVTTKITKNRAGGMGPELTYLALPTYADVVVTRVYDEGRDHALIGSLNPKVGNTYATIGQQPLDADGAPWGSPRTWRGRLSDIKDGTADSNSSAVRMWELTMVVETLAG
jgi:hypothetical protein